jgi:hypothetical protein
MKTNIIVTLQMEGLHNWPDAKTIVPIMGFLSDIHRHIFHITCKKEVKHNDRDVEFIMFKRDLEYYINTKYYSTKYNCLLFGPMSCEMIAKHLIDEFDLCYCKVMEDNENGAEIIK